MNELFGIFRHFRKREWALICVTVVLIVVQVYLDLEIPGYMAAVTDVLLEDGSPDLVIDKAVAMMACAVASLAVGIVLTATLGVVASGYSKHIRELQFDKVQRFSMEEMGRFNTYSLITRSTNDVKQIQDFISLSLMSLIKAPIISVWALYRIAESNFAWTTVTSVAVICMLVLVLAVLRKTIPGFKRIQKLTDGINRVSSELVEGIRFIRAYNAEEYENERFREANDELTNNNLYVYHIMNYNVPFNGLIRNCLTLAIYWTGAYIIMGTDSLESGMELFSNMIVFATYAVMILNGFRTMTHMFNIMPRASVSAHRINEVIDTEPSINDGDTEDSDEIGTVSFDDVSFRYPGAGSDAISGITFDVKRGETVSIIGSTGCGKTSLVNLIPRFYDTTSGTVRVDGVDVRDFSLEGLRGRIGFVSQTNSILSGTVRDNVNYGYQPGQRDDDDVWRALRIAKADLFVEDMGGLDSMLVEKGKNLSGGQKQRISIARTVNREPEIYIFDDSFSALDFKTDRDLRRSLRNETDRATVIIVAQRIGTVMDSDRIVVLDNGTMVGLGTHDELMRSCPVYREIADSQLEGGA